VHAIKVYGGVKVLYLFLITAQMRLVCQLHVPAAVSARKEPPFHIE
jgi:hypothetical protein